MIIALAVVPTDSLKETFEALSGQLPEELLPRLQWFEDNYIGHMDHDTMEASGG